MSWNSSLSFHIQIIKAAEPQKIFPGALCIFTNLKVLSIQPLKACDRLDQAQQPVRDVPLVVVDAEIAVNEPVTGGDNHAPGNLGMGGADLVRDVGGGFANGPATPACCGSTVQVLAVCSLFNLQAVTFFHNAFTHTLNHRVKKAIQNRLTI